jgi:CO/xanthine dehydrogenase FAD-binding subunit
MLGSVDPHFSIGAKPMKPAVFDYIRPGSLPEALAVLAQHGAAAKILAGGQSLVPMMNLRVVKPALVIDINRIPGLGEIRVDGVELVIGALARHAALLASELVKTHCPLMAEAYPWVAHGPIRNRGTLGGNISHADPASEMPAVLAACDAKIIARSAQATRTIPATEFFVAPLTTALAAGEMLTEIRIPSAPAGQGWSWQEEAVRKGDFAMAAVGVTLTLAGARCSEARVAIAGMERAGVRLAQVETQLAGIALDAARIESAAKLAAQLVQPGDSYHADARYKRELVEVLTARALTAALGRCR